MDEFKMPPDEMIEKGGKFITDSETINELFAELNGLISDLDGKWVGGAAESFLSKYESLKNSFQEMADCVGSIGNYMKGFGEEIIEVDNRRKLQG